MKLNYIKEENDTETNSLITVRKDQKYIKMLIIINFSFYGQPLVALLPACSHYTESTLINKIIYLTTNFKMYRS